jgi:hypothetical protein
MLKLQLWRKIVFGVIGLVLLVLFTACSGVGSNGPINGITGTITSVDTAHHTVTVSVNGQSYTIGGLSDQEAQALQSQIGKMYHLQVTQNSDGSYSITVGTNPTLANGETPGVDETPNANEPTSTGGSISFTGPVQSVSSSSLTVTLPDGSTAITMAINAQTDQSDLNGAQLHNGQLVKVDANASGNSFVATKIKIADSGDNTVDFQGTTTQTVGSDNVLHFSVGGQNFSYAISSTADLGDFGGHASSIASGTAVKVKVQFNGTTGNVIKVSNANS